MNIYIDFKKELGYQNVVNQYIELSQRSMHKDYKDILSNSESLKDFANEHGLHLSEIHNEIEIRISQNYIINVHTNFELFLTNFRTLSASPMKNAPKYDPEKENRLGWILNHIYGKHWTEDTKILYYICDYYRHARNCIIHTYSQEHSSKLASAKSRFNSLQHHEIFQKTVGQLQALNIPQEMIFDDQVLYSKAACKLAQKIFYESKYNIISQAKEEQDIIKAMICAYGNNPERQKAMIKMYFSKQYPIDKQDYETDFGIILEEINN